MDSGSLVVVEKMPFMSALPGLPLSMVAKKMCDDIKKGEGPASVKGITQALIYTGEDGKPLLVLTGPAFDIDSGKIGKTDFAELARKEKEDGKILDNGARTE